MLESPINAVVVPLAGVAVGVLGVLLLALAGGLGPGGHDQQRAEEEGLSGKHLLRSCQFRGCGKNEGDGDTVLLLYPPRDGKCRRFFESGKENQIKISI